MNLPEPPMRIPLDLLRETGNLWNNTLIFTLLNGGHLNPNLVMRTVKAKWKTSDTCDMVLSGHNLYVCRFNHAEDQIRVQDHQPWVALGCLILIQPFSNGMNASFIIFNTIPLWLSLKGLALEHLNYKTVQMIAAQAGEVDHVLPVGVIPRSAEGFRALVRVNVQLPLVQGYPCNTLQNGDVWVSFKYNNLPGLYCTTCFRLGHVRINCTFPPTNEVLEKHPTPSTTMSFEDNMQIVVWPHEARHFPAPHHEEGVPLQQEMNSVVYRHRLLGLAINNAHSMSGAHDWPDMGLLSQQDREVHAANRTRNLSPLTINEGGLPARMSTPTKMGLTDKKGKAPLFPEATHTAEFSPQMLYQPPPPPPSLISNATVVASTTHRRGRKLGSKNKNPKRVKNSDDKQSIQNKPDLLLGGKGKKRKLEDHNISTSSTVAYIPALPPINESQTEEPTAPLSPSTKTMELLQNLMLDPALTLHLVQQGIINSEILSHMPNQNLVPPTTNNTVIRNDTVHQEEIVQLNLSTNPIVPSVEFGENLVTIDPYGGSEERQIEYAINLSMGIQNSMIPGDRLLLSTSTSSESASSETSEEAECRGLCAAIRRGIEQQLSKVVIESDNQSAVDYLNGKSVNLSWQSAAILDQAVSLSKCFSSVFFTFCHRSGNALAHTLAALSDRSLSVPCIYVSPPSWVTEQLKLDLLFCNVICPMSDSVTGLEAG
ncbi:hypothetical protein FRX31_007710 [Thalictrum thalictroides]|uniref:RNase H type-1 domain-containing protein n=1 Tax=Thalictrum thalictroides TaxID=46969 RepID=A0A7J6X047_THATH|nr:hypothetical protein FRX31_007710 [Thalictrum thalictroides]